MRSRSRSDDDDDCFGLAAWFARPRTSTATNSSQHSQQLAAQPVPRAPPPTSPPAQPPPPPPGQAMAQARNQNKLWPGIGKIKMPEASARALGLIKRPPPPPPQPPEARTTSTSAASASTTWRQQPRDWRQRHQTPARLQLDLARIAKDGSIRTAPLHRGPAAQALRETRAMVQATLAEASIPIFKVGICYDPVHRWRGEDWSYVHEGYDFMQLLMWSTATDCKHLEMLAIEQYKDRPGCRCQNETTGGDGIADSEDMCYCYLVVADVSDPQWGRKRRRGLPRPQQDGKK